MAQMKSGKTGQVKFGASLYNEVTSWEMTDEVDTTRFGIFGGGGYKRTIAGQRSSSGTVEGKYNFDQPIEDGAGPGDSVVLSLYLDGSLYYTFTAVVKSLRFQCDGDSGAPVSWTLTFESDGAITEPV